MFLVCKFHLKEAYTYEVNKANNKFEMRILSS